MRVQLSTARNNREQFRERKRKTRERDMIEERSYYSRCDRNFKLTLIVGSFRSEGINFLLGLDYSVERFSFHFRIPKYLLKSICWR